jgi:GMP synthase (glutamine-hydrolysing)
MKTALVIRHVAFEDLGLFERTIEAAGYQVRYLEAGMDLLSWLEPLHPDLLIVLGGPIGANDEADYPFIRDEIDLLASRLQSDAPTLGICLGAQLMARALGAAVYPGSQSEIGWAPIQLSAAGQASPLRHLSADNTSVLHWHGDTFDLPVGAELLASTEQTMHQAFRWKRRGLALQFHPEVTVQGMERWYIGHSSDIRKMDNISVAALRTQTEQHGYNLEVHASRFMEEWLGAL